LGVGHANEWLAKVRMMPADDKQRPHQAGGMYWCYKFWHDPVIPDPKKRPVTAKESVTFLSSDAQFN
jgi:hypothetical protein